MTVVIFGGAGDLAHRKLLPALYNLHVDGVLPARLAIAGVGRKEMSDDDYRAFAPWATLLAEDFQAAMDHNATNPDRDLVGRGSKMSALVPPTGFEPALPPPEGGALSPELRGPQTRTA